MNNLILTYNIIMSYSPLKLIAVFRAIDPPTPYSFYDVYTYTEGGALGKQVGILYVAPLPLPPLPTIQSYNIYNLEMADKSLGYSYNFLWEANLPYFGTARTFTSTNVDFTTNDENSALYSYVVSSTKLINDNLLLVINANANL
jgi:hypothetical protein